MSVSKPRYARPPGWRIGVYPLLRVSPTYGICDSVQMHRLCFYLHRELCDYGYGYWVEYHVRFTWLRRGREDDFLVAIGNTWWNNV